MAAALAALVTLLAAACGGAATTTTTSNAPKAPDSVVIAYQPGIGYAPLLLMKQERWIEQDYPGTKVEYRLLSNGDAIRDGIIAGQIQVGSGGTGPFLVGWAKGLDYRLIAGMNDMDLWLNVRDPAVRSLRDLKPDTKIASPAVDSIQAMALRKLAQDQLGDAHKLDANLVAMAHPDALQNLFAGSIGAHFTSPPYEFQEVQRGAHTIATSYAAFGPSTFNSAFTTQRFYEQYPDFVRKLYQYIVRADQMINKDPAGSAALVAAADGKPDMADQYRQWMTTPDVVSYNTKPAGFMGCASFMKQIGSISRAPKSIKELELPFLQSAGGS
jgi:NitT/TauT family transport system substrate-binding protein